MLRVEEPSRSVKAQVSKAESGSDSLACFCLVQFARAIVLGSLAYAAWRNGAMQSDTLLHLSVALGLALFISLIAQPKNSDVTPIPRVLFYVSLAWILYAAIQMMPIPWGGSLFFHGPIDAHETFVAPAAAELSSAISRLSDAVLPEIVPRATVALDESRRALVPFLIGLAYAFLTWRLFQTSQSRRVLLWALVANCTLLSMWGILQRAGGSVDILPGMEHQVSSLPFSSFVYKNAGAAAILPGAAAAVLLLALKRVTTRSHYRYTRSESWLTPYRVTLILCFTVIVTGIGVSLSRGAWAAALVSCVIIAMAHRPSVSKKMISIAVAVPVCFLTISWIAQDVNDSVQQRVSDLSLDVISTDSRWEHWKDGLQTAKAHFPSGSGLGTYGYATLPFQDQTHPTWYREAHNQFLEIVTESGIIGLSLLAILMFWFVKTCFGALRSERSGNTVAWALFGIAIFCFATVQSLADFVLTIPSNLFLYAILVSVVAGELMSHRAASSHSLVKRPHEHSTSTTGFAQFKSHLIRWRGRYSWTIASAACLMWAVLIGTDQVLTRSVTDETKITELEDSARPESTEDVLQRLDQAIAANPYSALLYERRAAWRILQYRCNLVDEATQRDQPIDWNATEPLNILNFIAAVPEAYRAALLNEFVSVKRLREPLVATMKDLRQSLELNPLRPTIHFRATTIASITGMQMNSWLDRSARLSNNDVDKLFRNGFVAYIERDDVRMVDQWTRSLSIDHRHLETIFKLAQTRLTPIQIAQELALPTRPDLLIRLAQPTMSLDGTDGPSADPDSLIDPDLAHQLIDQLNHASEVPDDLRYSVLAQFSEALSDKPSAANYWKKAVAAKPRLAKYRIRYTETLLSLGRYQEAVDQAILGRKLHPQENRFDRLTDAARMGITKQQ
ncbi:O-antigen ligase family protein [Novipirellula artificiosorum]|uniref:O-Antigen ligase n=1 Tax=Novipirellula artificiosorum TaxID=2528016 RepID=A0A5C6DSG5_9BACT|nr:O-antigen ligase family protein [Novipirellula artificiosorum]TWU39205.1 O-Antigen ligase [Novipirellula artificiosorum]